LFEKAVVTLRLSPEVSRQLSIQTPLGAGKLAANSYVAPDELRRRGTSPGGTTEQALLSFADQGFESIVAKAMLAAQQRAAELAK